MILDLCNKTQNNEIVWKKIIKDNPNILNMYKSKGFTLTEFFWGMLSDSTYMLEYKKHWYSKKEKMYLCCDDLKFLCNIIEYSLFKKEKSIGAVK